MYTSSKKIRYFLKIFFFFLKAKLKSQATENVSNVYGPATVTVNHEQLWFRRFCSRNFDTKDATAKPSIRTQLGPTEKELN